MYILSATLAVSEDGRRPIEVLKIERDLVFELESTTETTRLHRDPLTGS